MKIFLLIFLLVISVITYAQTTQMPIAGEIIHIDHFQSEYITSRNIDIWLPENYHENKKHAVLYMHDGQMLFDDASTWNEQSWNVDDVLTSLLQADKIIDLIVVGIWNDDKNRHADYFPQKPFESLTLAQQTFVNNQVQAAGRTNEEFKPVSDNYLKFIVNELKPHIDTTFSVHSSPSQTFIAGSSMGGLISIYAICEYPEIFGGTACLSTHWPGIFSWMNNPVPDAFFSYLKLNLPDPETHKIYFDHGDQTLDAMYPALQKKVDEVMKTNGFTEANWKTQFFEGKDHSEKAWSERFDIPAIFLFGK